MNSNASLIPLGEIVSIKGGKRLPKGAALQSIKNSHPYIRVRDMGQRYIPSDGLEYVPDEVFPKIQRYIVHENDVIISIVGTIGLVSVIDSKFHLASQTENAAKLTGLDSIDAHYLYYYLNSHIGQSEIRQRTVGAVQPKLPLYNIETIPIIWPGRPSRTEVVKQLMALDGKIQLNQQINQTLEQMAQAIFKSWFVDFDPVKAKIAALEAGGSADDALLAAMQAIAGSALFTNDAADADAKTQLVRLQAEHPEQYATLRATAELFPSAMQESELGEIPEGWFLPSFEELTTAKQGRYLSKDKMLAVANEEFKVPVWGGNGILGYAEKSAYSSPVVLMTCRGSNCGLIKHTESEAWVSNNSFACSPCIGSSWFLLNYFKLSTFEDCISGSAQPQITHTALKTKQLRFPVQQQLCERYSEIINPIFNHILQLKKEIITLEETRDTLLPKLLSGELSVAAAEEQLADTVEPAHV